MRHVCETWSLQTLLCDSVKIILIATDCSVMLRANIQIDYITWGVSHWSCPRFCIICYGLLAGVVINVVLKIWIRHTDIRLVFTSTDQDIARIVERTCVSSLLVVKWDLSFIYFEGVRLLFILFDVILIIVYLLNVTVIFLIVLSWESIFKTCRKFFSKHRSFFRWWTFNQELGRPNYWKIISSFLDLPMLNYLVIVILSNLWNILSCI